MENLVFASIFFLIVGLILGFFIAALLEDRKSKPDFPRIIITPAMDANFLDDGFYLAGVVTLGESENRRTCLRLGSSVCNQFGDDHVTLRDGRSATPGDSIWIENP